MTEGASALGAQHQGQLRAELGAVGREDHREEDKEDEKHLAELQSKHRRGLAQAKPREKVAPDLSACGLTVCGERTTTGPHE
jgi:hypothetical protein